MGIALFALSNLFAPLQTAASRFAPAQTRTPVLAGRPAAAALDDPSRRTSPRTLAANEPGTADAALGRSKGAPRRAPALRVVRNIEAGIPVGSSGRMVISGRMADVCAELDRLANLENTRRGATR